MPRARSACATVGDSRRGSAPTSSCGISSTRTRSPTGSARTRAGAWSRAASSTRSPRSRPMPEALFDLHRGTTPLVVSLPHAGRAIPYELAPRLVERALSVEDTDWHLDHLYAFAPEIGASLLVPKLSRYAVDLNRPPEDTPMYPGVNNTGLC